LIVGSSEAALGRASRTVDAAGYRKVALTIGEAAERIAIQPAASAIWIELDEDAGEPLDRLFDQVNAEASTARYPAIVAAPMALVDPLMARIRHPEIDLLIDASLAERAAALATATAWSGYRNRGVNEDISRESPEPSSARLRQLSDEVSRIAATLARLSAGPGASVEKPEPLTGDAPPVSLETVRQVIRARRLRARFFDEELFADPAWDMLLDLLQAEIAQHRVPVSSLCIAASVPATTALRWIKTMTDAGMFNRRADPHDGRRVFVELSPKTSEAMRLYFREIGKVIVV
jgi:DNA-binding MarR family transcriptional regulator